MNTPDLIKMNKISASDPAETKYDFNEVISQDSSEESKDTYCDSSDSLNMSGQSSPKKMEDHEQKCAGHDQTYACLHNCVKWHMTL